MSQNGQSGTWDGSFYRVHTAHLEAALVPHAGKDLDAVDNVDVFVDLPDRSRRTATIITFAQVDLVMKRWAASGDAVGGRRFWLSDGLIVRDAGSSNMTPSAHRAGRKRRVHAGPSATRRPTGSSGQETPILKRSVSRPSC
ncbi:hypothetical protein [Streptomyces sp. NPDC059893]|uniref:hypothetical protein n=1 Tax=Streptomyces sp. NPDC059893 TaxID=3346990 RepID=UPI00366736DE